MQEENNYQAAITEAFDGYLAEQAQLYQDFKDEVEQKWDEFKYSSSKTYVDYDSDLNARGSVDFENGVVEIEVIVDDDPQQSVADKKQLGDEKLQEKLTQIVTKKQMINNHCLRTSYKINRVKK